MCQSEIAVHKSGKDRHTADVERLCGELSKAKEDSDALQADIGHLNQQTVNTTAAKDSINSLLKAAGFQGFYLREKPGAQYVYELIRETDEKVAKSDLEDFCRDLDELESICGAADDTYDDENEEYNDALEQLKSHFNTLSVDWLKKTASEEGTLYQLVAFNTEDKANDILQREYTSEAYDENLDKYIEIAMNSASDIYSSLHNAFDDVADDFLSELQKILSALKAAIDFTNVWKAAKVNPEIDNT